MSSGSGITSKWSMQRVCGIKARLPLPVVATHTSG